MDEHLGGIEAFVLNSYTEIHGKDIHIDFLKITNKIYYEEVFISHNSKVHQITSRRKNPLKFYFELYKLLKNEKYDIIHHHLNSCSSIEPIILGKILGIKTIAHSHNEFKGNKFITKLLHKFNTNLLKNISDFNLACSKIAGQSMFKNKKFEVIKNGIKTVDYNFNENIRTNYRKELNLEDKFVIGHVGSFKYQKNHEFLLEVFKRITEDNNFAHLLLIGDGEKKIEIIKAIEMLQLQDKVTLLGVRNDVNQIMQAMDVFTFPSRYEGLGIVVIEAQAAGLKTIVSEAIPSEAIITDLVEVINLKDSIKKWSNNIIKYSVGYSRKGMEVSIQNAGYDTKESNNKLRKIYLELYQK